MINIQQALQHARTTLSDFADAELEAEYLLAHIIHKNRAYLRAFSEVMLTAQQQQAFIASLQRRQQGEPLAYITGQKEFWGLALQVTPAVLIPRPETELIVEHLLQILPASDVCRVADLGTGSGAIALAIASERPHWQISATDSSAAALAIAQQNAHTLGIKNVEFKLGHWCDALSQHDYHAIVSNPPYIDQQDPAVEKNVRAYEPSNALFALDNGLADLSTIITSAKQFLIPSGYLLLEHGYQQAPIVTAYLHQQAYQAIHTYADYHQLPRMTLARWQTDF